MIGKLKKGTEIIINDISLDENTEFRSVIKNGKTMFYPHGLQCDCFFSEELFDIYEDEKYKYEMFFKSEPGDRIIIDGWLPISTDILDISKIDDYIERGLLRKIDE